MIWIRAGFLDLCHQWDVNIQKKTCKIDEKALNGILKIFHRSDLEPRIRKLITKETNLNRKLFRRHKSTRITLVSDIPIILLLLIYLIAKSHLMYSWRTFMVLQIFNVRSAIFFWSLCCWITDIVSNADFRMSIQCAIKSTWITVCWA